MFKQFIVFCMVLLQSYKLCAQNLTTKDIEQFERKAKQAVQSFVNSVRGYEYLVEVDRVGSVLKSSTDVQQIELVANIQYRIDQQIYIGGLIEYDQSSTKSQNESNISMYAVGTYFFQSDVLNGFYGRLALGFHNSNQLEAPASAFLISLGKHWQIFERITLSPHLQTSKKGSMNSVFEIYPLSISVWF